MKLLFTKIIVLTLCTGESCTPNGFQLTLITIMIIMENLFRYIIIHLKE